MSDQQAQDESWVAKAISIPGREVTPSQQIKEDTAFSGLDVVEYPDGHRPDHLAALATVNGRLAACIDRMAKNVVGQGWELVPATKEIPADDTEFLVERERIREFLRRPNPRMPFSELLRIVKMDEEATGNGYIEVTRNLAGDIAGLFHVPSATVRIRRGGKGFVQIRGGVKRFFRCFGDEVVMDSRNGKTIDDDGVGEIPFEHQASEILHLSIYSPASSYYGLPRHLPASLGVATNREIGKYNLAFFANDGTPRGILQAIGFKPGDELTREVRTFFAGGKGAENSHRVLMLFTPKKLAGTEGEPRFHWDSVGMDGPEEGSFLALRQENDEEIRELYGIGKIYLRPNDVNRASAEVEAQLTNSQTLEPDRVRIEFLLNETILRDMGAEKCRLAFTRPKLSDDLERAKVDDIHAKHGGLTPADMRVRAGEEPYPDDEEHRWARRPLQVQDADDGTDLEGELDGSDGQEEKAVSSRLVRNLLRLRRKVERSIRREAA